ncbi:hypothetical protein K0M31_000286, partial [Melipona bicolor]
MIGVSPVKAADDSVVSPCTNPVGINNTSSLRRTDTKENTGRRGRNEMVETAKLQH